MKTRIIIGAMVTLLVSLCGLAPAQERCFTSPSGNEIVVCVGSRSFAAPRPQKSDHQSTFGDWRDNADIVYSAQFVVGGGGAATYASNGLTVVNGYGVSLRMVNLTTQQVNIEGSWTDSTGNGFGANLQFSPILPILLPAGSFVTTTLSSLASAEWTASSGTSALKTGMLTVFVQRSPSGHAGASVSMVIRHKTNGVIDGMAEMPLVTPLSAFSGFVKKINEGGISTETGIALANPSVIQPATVTVTLTDWTGLFPGGLKVLVLPPLGQQAMFLSQLFPNFQSSQGSLDISSDKPVVYMFLENSGFAFSSLVAGPARPVN